MYPVSGTAIPIDPCVEGPCREGPEGPCFIETPNLISLDKISQKFSLDEEETEIIQNGVNDYCSNNLIGRLAFSSFDYVKSLVTKNTPWQNAVTVLENKIVGEKRKEVAIFLLTFCLTVQRLNKRQAPIPKLSAVYLGITIEEYLEKASCTIIPPFEKKWKIGKNPNTKIDFSEEV